MNSLEVGPNFPLSLFVLLGFLAVNGAMLIKKKKAPVICGVNLLLIAWAILMCWMAFSFS